MNLFNYLMAKKGHNTSVRDDLFAYLLGKRTRKEVKTASGTTISISDVTREKIESLTLSKESTQDGTPSPENPVEVKTVKGNVGITITNGTNTRNYTIPLGNNEICGIGNYKDELIVDKNGKCWLSKKIGKYVINGNENMEYKGTSNDLYAYSIPNFENYENNVSSLSNYFKTYNTYGWSNALNRGISICLLNYGTSTNRSIYIITDKTSINDLKQWLQDKYNNNTPVILYYVLATENLIDLNYTVDITLFEGVNNISNSEDMDMILKYY